MKIKIGWKTYDVVIKEEIYVDSKKCYGSIDYNNHVISLWEANKPDQSEATLLHEALHGIADMYTIDLNEEDVLKLADALYIFIKDNPKLINYSFGGDTNE